MKWLTFRCLFDRIKIYAECSTDPSTPRTQIKNFPRFCAQGRSPRLAGGIPVQIGDFPYLIASVHPEIRCTASLINPSWALGAAHCYIVDSERVNPKDVALIAGIADFNQTRLPSSQIRRAKSINIHPNFEEVKISGADLSLVGVNTPFELNEYVDVIQVSGSPFLLNEDVQCTASGWGDTSTTKTNSHLHKLDVVAVQSKGVCHGLTTKERKNMLCLKSDDGKGLCDGDSGGPLICENELVGVAHQVYIERLRLAASGLQNVSEQTLHVERLQRCCYTTFLHDNVVHIILEKTQRRNKGVPVNGPSQQGPGSDHKAEILVNYVFNTATDYIVSHEALSESNRENTVSVEARSAQESGLTRERNAMTLSRTKCYRSSSAPAHTSSSLLCADISACVEECAFDSSNDDTSHKALHSRSNVEKDDRAVISRKHMRRNAQKAQRLSTLTRSGSSFAEKFVSKHENMSPRAKHAATLFLMTAVHIAKTLRIDVHRTAIWLSIAWVGFKFALDEKNKSSTQLDRYFEEILIRHSVDVENSEWLADTSKNTLPLTTYTSIVSANHPRASNENGGRFAGRFCCCFSETINESLPEEQFFTQNLPEEQLLSLCPGEAKDRVPGNQRQPHLQQPREDTICE
ncbi:unnamed protein product [Nesidiocoris tenuis]|uniref:Peptidase S1 domain-containing protein n=1 Tax=Nesidiocoris tenuis TaxID=355587 RepID=A0A6H5G6X7_9HEMI|nr:unnamed protein product [Nesidiocoris tenuis]